MAGLNGLKTEFPVVHDLECDITANAAAAQAVELGTIPAGSLFLDAFADVQTVFSAGTLEIVGFLCTVGQPIQVNPVVAAADFTFLTTALAAAGVATASPNIKVSGAGCTTKRRLSATQAVAVYIRTSAAQATGAASASVSFIPNRRAGNA